MRMWLVGLVCCVFTTTDYPCSLKCLLCMRILPPLTLVCADRDSVTQLQSQDYLIYMYVFLRICSTPHQIDYAVIFFKQLDVRNCYVLVCDSLLNMNRQSCQMQFIEGFFLFGYLLWQGSLIRVAS